MMSRNGYALPSVIVISTLFTTMVFLVLTLVYFYIERGAGAVNATRLELACYSAVQKIKSGKIAWEPGYYMIEVGKSKVNVEIRNKGLFREIVASAEMRGDSTAIRYLIGADLPQQFRNAFIMSRPGVRGKVTGETFIKGDVISTTGRFESGIIFGVEPQREKFVTGEILVDTDLEVKLFDEESVIRIFSILEEGYFYDDFTYLHRGDLNIDTEWLDIFNGSGYRKVMVEGEVNISGKFLHNSPADSLVIYSRGDIVVGSGTISNLDLHLYTDSNVLFHGNPDFDNLLIVARGSISMHGGGRFKNTQMFSQSGVYIGNSDFLFPSVLLLYDTTSGIMGNEKLLSLASSVVNGSLLYIADNPGIPHNRSRIVVDGGSKVHGLIYSENNVELHGSVYGSVYTYGTWYYKEPSVYLNWLVGYDIDRDTLDGSFLTGFGFNGLERSKILKDTWIY